MYAQQTLLYIQGDVPQLPSILPGEPPRAASTPVAALTEAANAIQSTAESQSNTATPASPGGSFGALDQPAASSTASAMTQQAALRSGAGSVTSQRGQGWLRAMWNRFASTIHTRLARSPQLYRVRDTNEAHARATRAGSVPCQPDTSSQTSLAWS